MRTKVTKDGFVWLTLSKKDAIALYDASDIQVYRLYDDDSEGMILTKGEIMGYDGQLGVEVGFIKDLLPACPHCGGKLIPGRHDGYEWECLECDEDFRANEI